MPMKNEMRYVGRWEMESTLCGSSSNAMPMIHGMFNTAPKYLCGLDIPVLNVEVLVFERGKGFGSADSCGQDAFRSCCCRLCSVDVFNRTGQV